MDTLADWIKLAPKPFPLRDGQKWHVFLSYRSEDLSWAIQLYDVLHHLGFEVFLDQLVLGAGTRIIGGIEEGLQKSAAGVLIVSTETMESEWCKDEYEAMVERKNLDKDFYFVVAKLDDVKLPPFLRNTLYEDFSGCPEGPRGTALMKLVYGITGKPLPEDVVRLAMRIDGEVKQGLARIRAAQATGDSEELLKLADSPDLAWAIGSLLRCQAAEALIHIKHESEALEVLRQVEADFPQSIRPKQLTTMALVRLGDWPKAQKIIAEVIELQAPGKQDLATMTLYARTWMDRYHAEGNELFLRKSRALYAEAFTRWPLDCHTGINAACTSLLLGEADVAKVYAEKVAQVIGTDPGFSYCKTAALATALLIEEDYAKAGSYFQKAVENDPLDYGDHESTRAKAEVIMAKLPATPEQRALVSRAFHHLSGNKVPSWSASLAPSVQAGASA